MNKLLKGLKLLNWKVNDALFSLRLKQLSPESGVNIILVYHGVTDDAKTDINSRFISTTLFERQLKFFKTHYHILRLPEYFDSKEKYDKPKMAITFDDGYLNNLTHALPILEKLQVPATFFISTIRHAGYDYLWADLLDLFRYTGPSQFTFKDANYTKIKGEYTAEGNTLKQRLKESDWSFKKALCDHILSNNNFVGDKQFSPYLELMNEEQIRQLSQSSYAEIGSHGVYHNCLTEISTEEATNEMRISKSYLENIIGKEVRYFAYPDGRYSKELMNAAEQSGYHYQLLVDYNDETDQSDHRARPRFGINPYISFKNQMQCIINGKY